MSTSSKARKRPAARRGKKAAAPADQFRALAASAKEAVQTKNGQFFMGVIQFLVSLLSLLYFKGVIRLAYNSLFYRLDIPEEHQRHQQHQMTVIEQDDRQIERH